MRDRTYAAGVGEILEGAYRGRRPAAYVVERSA